MTRIDFDWDPTKAATNRAKHGVAFEEAMLVFDDPLALSLRDDDHSLDEERWITLGATAADRLVVVVHTFRESSDGEILVRIISARRPTRRETRQYVEG